MDDYRDPPPDPKLAKDMARLEQMLLERAKNNPLEAAREELDLIESVVRNVRSRARPSRIKKFFQRILFLQD